MENRHESITARAGFSLPAWPVERRVFYRLVARAVSD